MKKQPSRTAPPAITAGLRRYLYATATVTGAAIMIIEILGARMLAPYLGTSHFVWTAQIAVTLVALAAGYYAGGLFADRRPQLGPLYVAIALSALYLCVTIAVVRPVAYWCLEFRLALGSLLASTFLFFVPLALLAMVGPFFVRFLAHAVTDVSGTMGRLTALGTLGSFAGTLLIGYVLTPLLPNSVTLYATAAILLAVSTAYFLGWAARSPAKPAAVAALVGGLLVGAGAVRIDSRPPFTDAVEVFRGNSNFGQLQVIDSPGGNRRFYLNDYLVQNNYDPVARQSVTLFTYMLRDLARAYTPRLDRALCIGLGIGIVPSELAAGGTTVDVVEINPAVVPVAEKFFGCRLDRFRLFLGDGRDFLNRATNRYDTVILDAFLGDSSPSHLMTRESFESIRRVLAPDGTLVINCFADFSRDRDFFAASLEKTLRAVFQSVRIHAAGNGNVFYVASPLPELRVLRPPDPENIHPAIRSQAHAAFATEHRTRPEDGRVLTDDFNPVDFFDAGNREAIRRSLALSMRGL